MKRDIAAWVRECITCQQVKITRHTKPPIGTFFQPDARFDHLHMDIVGPLSVSEGMTYLLTIVDRFTRWPEAIPMADMTADTVCRALISQWIARLGVLSTITTDQGRQFQSSLFKQLTELLGTTRIRTTAYHPASNGLVESLHRQLKGALTAHVSQGHTQWTQVPPFILLSLRSVVKEDIGTFCAELVYGTTLRFPGDLLFATTPANYDMPTYITQLREIMQSLTPSPTSSHNLQKVFVHPELKTCSHVFLRVDKVKPPLTPNYTRPHKVLRRLSRTFQIDFNGKPTTATLEWIKPAFVPNSSYFPDLTKQQQKPKTQGNKERKKVRFILPSS